MNWLEIAGATIATTFSPPAAASLSMRITFRMKDLSLIAPNGHWYTHAPHEMHLSWSIDAALSSLIEIALTLHAIWQGRLRLMIAVYGHTSEQRPHSTHLVLSMNATWLWSNVIAPRGHTSSHRCARQPRQDEVTSYPAAGHSSQAMSMT